MEELRIITNNVPRLVIDAWELTPKEREEFDYLDWQAIERGEDSASFFRYRGTLYDLGDMERGYGGQPMPEVFKGWDNYLSDSFFSGVLVRYCQDTDYVVIGRYYS